MSDERFNIRMKGGVSFDSDSQKFIITIRVWNNIDCAGEPDKEFTNGMEFDTEDKANTYYRGSIRPLMDQMERALIDELPPGSRLVQHVGDI